MAEPTETPLFDRTASNTSEGGLYEVGYDNDSVGHITIVTGLDHSTHFHLEDHYEIDEDEEEYDIIGEDIVVKDEHLEEFARFLINAGHFLLERKKMKDAAAKVKDA
jgi:hypothetical protein